MAGKPNKNAIYLTDEEYNTLSSLSKKKSSCKTLKCRCHVLMDLDNNHGKRLTYSQSARANGVCPATVSNITKLYRDGGINAVIALKRNVNSDNARRKMDGRAEARIIEIACSPAPEGHSRWTLRGGGACHGENFVNISSKMLTKFSFWSKIRILVDMHSNSERAVVDARFVYIITM